MGYRSAATRRFAAPRAADNERAHVCIVERPAVARRQVQEGGGWLVKMVEHGGFYP